MSPECLLAILLNRGVNIMASCSQVGPTPYTGITYERFARCTYNFDIKLERDHLGKGGEDLAEWCERDKSYGFTGAMLHVFEPGPALAVMDRFDMEWQVGPGEDDTLPTHLDLWARTASRATWFSFPTGCRIIGLGNRGEFYADRVEKMKRLYPTVLVRGHNCDYLDRETLCHVAAHVDGVNVAPQLGVIQSSWYLTHALAHGLPIDDWVGACIADEKNRRRWSTRPWDVVHAVGHYHFDLIEWRASVENEVVKYLARYIQDLLRYVT